MAQKKNSDSIKNIAADTDALLLSAGLGARLKPLTNKIPKPLVRVCNRPLIDWNLSLLAKSGFKRVFINIFYKGDLIRDFVGDGSKWNLKIIYSQEKELLDTGGAIKKIADQIQTENLLTFNSDTLLDPKYQLNLLLNTHVNNPNKPLATLLLRKHERSQDYGEIFIDSSSRIVQFLDVTLPTFQQNSSDKNYYNHLIYIGVQVLSKELISNFPTVNVFSITKDIYRTLIREGKYLSSLLYNAYWSDVGTPERLEKASKEYQQFL